MSVKNAVAEWVATHKGEDFRASEVAVAIDSNIANVRSALTALKDEHVVESVKWGVYRAYTGSHPEEEAAEDTSVVSEGYPIERATEGLRMTLENLNEELKSIVEQIDILDHRRTELMTRHDEILSEAKKVESAYEVLVG